MIEIKKKITRSSNLYHEAYTCPECGCLGEKTYTMYSGIGIEAEMFECNQCGCEWTCEYHNVEKIYIEPDNQILETQETDTLKNKLKRLFKKGE